ncbi:MAG: helix-hairpin-helix domain-containing protein, partial [Candidatus Aureabacteria bacterium]|nr:helix-hairpin-helix domain-containing protein [Candidatus Auribacterota bacterium]
GGTLYMGGARCLSGRVPGDLVTVYVAGAVGAPGAYRVRRESRAANAAFRASPRADAQMEYLDGSLPVVAGEVVYVPARGETVAAAELKRETLLKKLREPAQLVPIDLNSASVEELTALPGIGEKLAEAIVLERTRAPFANVDALRRVPGMGAKKLDRIRDYVMVEDFKLQTSNIQTNQKSK